MRWRRASVSTYWLARVSAASGIVYGNAKDMQDMADLLSMLSDNIASIYAAKAGGDAAEWERYSTEQESVFAEMNEEVFTDGSSQ